jgi:hypothetical protein
MMQFNKSTLALACLFNLLNLNAAQAQVLPEAIV